MLPGFFSVVFKYDTVSDLKGDGRIPAWDKGIPTRYQAAMQQAQDALAKMPYPPVTQ